MANSVSFRPIQDGPLLMSQRTAHGIIYLFSVASLVAIAFSVIDFRLVLDSIEAQRTSIPLDTGSYYSLASTVILLGPLVILSKHPSLKRFFERHLNSLAVWWFVLMLFLANVIPWYLQTKLVSNGYVACRDVREISRVSIGKSLIYRMASCNGE